jgi:hypoxanthine-guanine phosphoribosyltransferase
LGGRLILKAYKPIAPYRQVWEKTFPPVILQAAIGGAKKNSRYEAAKAGEIEAALILAHDLVNDETLQKIANLIGNKKPLLIPVHAEEAISINRIPLAYAMIIAEKLNLDVELNIVQAAKVSRTGTDGFSRLAFPPPFSGKPSIESDYAIILDDTLTQGGTLANLKGYVKQFGIETLVATTLTGKNYSSVLAISTDTLVNLREKYHELESWWIEFFGYGFDCLTESEARYVLNSKKDANAIRNRIITERQKGVF